MVGEPDFQEFFSSLTGFEPMPWQEALYARFIGNSEDGIPACCDIPTGLGKTSVIAIWLIALANYPDKMPRRLVYVVNRRTVVDQTTNEVEKIRRYLEEMPKLESLRGRVGPLAISTLRGQYADNREWSADPSRPAVICGTVDMIGSRLLFSGYRIGFKSKPLHAGFLGQDALLVHDEAHLEPAFQSLIETIETEQAEKELAEDMPWQKLRVMSLSATARSKEDVDSKGDEDKILRLSSKDRQHSEVKKRFEAAKQLVLHPIKDERKELVDAVVAKALEYEMSNQAVLIFLWSVEDVGKVADALKKHDKKRRWVETLTGTLRGLERDKLVETSVFQRFLPESNRDTEIESAEDTVYLVCTSAGEVGVNISADHLVCDLSTFDSMAQRFGRVNRFGRHRDTQIDVVHPDSFDEKNPNPQRMATLALLQQLDGDASPHALDKLDATARHNAFAPEPTILPATDILFDAWSLTTIVDKMPGRPPVEPYLHGVAEWEPPQTQVAWREEVDITDDDDLRVRYKPQDLLEAYPLKPHELLRDQSERVFGKLQSIATRSPSAPVWLIREDGRVMPTTLSSIADPAAKSQQKKLLVQAIGNATILLPPRVGGLQDGFLDGKDVSADDVADQWFGIEEHDGEEISVQRRIRVGDNDPDLETKTKGMALIRTLDTNPDGEEREGPNNDDESDGAKMRFWYWYVRPRDAEDATPASTEQITWKHHTDDVVKRTTDIVKALELPDDMKQALILSAKFHDLGKKRELWQRSIGHPLPENPQPDDWLAKSGGNRKRLGFRIDYRHEFGSLLDVLDPEPSEPNQPENVEFKALSADMQELVLHLIAAHHGRARPHFPEKELYDLAPGNDTRAAEQALEVPRRFTRLQRKYGRWGLAYLESILRAADWAASAKPSSLEKSEEDHA